MKTDKPEAKPVIPDKAKEFPANHVPPKGISAFQMFKDKHLWSVWRFTVKENGDIETQKIVEMEPFELCRHSVHSQTINAQLEQIK